MNVLIRHPSVGSVWLERAQFVTMPDGREFVQGEVFDRSDVGSLDKDCALLGEPLMYPDAPSRPLLPPAQPNQGNG